MARVQRAGPAVLFSLLVVILLELLVNRGWIHSYLIPSPSMVALALYENPIVFLQAFKETALAATEGFLLSVGFGIFLAFIFSLHPWVRRALFPFTVFFETVPIVAIAPLLVIWFGFGLSTVRASALIVSLFPILSSCMAGLDSASSEFRELFHIYGATSWQILWKLQVPSSLRLLFSGMRISAGLAVVGALVGEFVAGGGLGGLIDSARTQQRVDFVFLALVLSTVLALMLMGLVALAQRAMGWRRPYFES